MYVLYGLIGILLFVVSMDFDSGKVTRALFFIHLNHLADPEVGTYYAFVLVAIVRPDGILHAVFACVASICLLFRRIITNDPISYHTFSGILGVGVRRIVICSGYRSVRQ